MKKSSMLINVARGAVLDQNALYNALKSKEIKCAALDVFDPEPLPSNHPLKSLDNIVFSPHTGGSGKEAYIRQVESMISNIESYLSSGVVVKEAI